MKLFDILFQDRYQDILLDFMHENGVVGEEIVKVCAYHKSSHFILNYVKLNTNLNFDDVLVCALLGCCFNVKNYRKIVYDLGRQGIVLSVSQSLENIIQALPESDLPQFFNILKLLDLENLIDEYEGSVAYNFVENHKVASYKIEGYKAESYKEVVAQDMEETTG